MDIEKAKTLLGQTDEERTIAFLRREAEHWRAQAQQWEQTAARLDLYIEQKNLFIAKLEKTVKYLRGRA